jgi:hypothetical protein
MACLIVRIEEPSSDVETMPYFCSSTTPVLVLTRRPGLQSETSTSTHRR